MAAIGLKYMAWAPMALEPDDAAPTYGTGIVLGRSVSTNLTINNAEGELYADDMLSEYVSEFASGELAAEVDNIAVENQAKLYGATYADGEMQMGGQDTAPYGGVGGYQVVMVRGVRKYRTWFFAKAKASIPDWTGTTRGSSISFATQPISMRVMAPAAGPWYRVKEFTDESAAKAYIDQLLNVATWYSVNIQVQGASGTDAVTPVGVVAVAAGEDLALTITGTPTALYDNGTDNVSSASGGTYTISEIAADHAVAVIF